MAYIKYKELTRYFNFKKEAALETLPKYVMDYVYDGEEVFAAFKTRKDYGVFTDKKILLFDHSSLIGSKEIHTIYYDAISTFSISFKLNLVDIVIYLDCGYPMRLRFINLSPQDKTKLRLLYKEISARVANRHNN